jgi:hypothetical protein
VREEESQRYEKLRSDKANAEASLRAEIEEMARERAESERDSEARYRRLETLKVQETKMLKSRIDKLSKLQDAASNSGGAKARAMLYEASVAAKFQQKLQLKREAAAGGAVPPPTDSSTASPTPTSPNPAE